MQNRLLPAVASGGELAISGKSELWPCVRVKASQTNVGCESVLCISIIVICGKVSELWEGGGQRLYIEISIPLHVLQYC
jgi:hypothetical protein